MPAGRIAFNICAVKSSLVPSICVLAVDALCSFETWDLMRTDNNLSRADTISALVTALSALLA